MPSSPPNQPESGNNQVYTSNSSPSPIVPGVIQEEIIGEEFIANLAASGISNTMTSSPNTWSALQTFGNNISIGGAQFAIASLASGQIIYYNGTNFINNANISVSSSGIISVVGIKTTAGAATAVTAGASPYTYANSSSSNQQIFIQGGTVSAISYNPNGGTGIALSALTDNILVLRPNDSVTITYTAAPTINTIQL